MNDKVFIGVPTHDRRVDIGTAYCLYRSGLAQKQVKMQVRSLLALNFNDLWCQALNSGADYFMLLHSDIEVATEDWGVKMLEIMKREQVDVLSVLSPIKNTNDFSSGMSDANCAKRYRFSREDIAKLPPTFRTADVRKVWQDEALVMIFNSGCLMIRLKKVEALVSYFQMADKIVKEDDKYACDCVPEDWFFSVVCHKLCVPYACTREIELIHYGAMGWSNQL